EELHTENRCPRCASDSFAFLSTWLPTEERRRWRRPQERAHASSRLGGLGHLIARLFRREGSNETPTPTRRRSDVVLNLTFEEQPTKRTHDCSPTQADRPAASSHRS